jgi:hypothetical protein
MPPEQPMSGVGLFQWNRGGWFGGQVGSTAWMLVGAAVLARQAPQVAVAWLLFFVVANAIGFWLWGRRDRLRPYPAQQALVLVCGISSVLALATLHLLQPGVVVNQIAGVRLQDEPQLILSLLGMLIFMMAHFHLMERSARKQRSTSERQHSA